MTEFLKRIISFSREKITILLWKGPTHDDTETYVIVPRKILGTVSAFFGGILFIVLLFFFLTPLGTLLFNREDQAVREQILEIRERVEALRDSLHASELQLAMFKQALAAGSDTTFITRLQNEDFSRIYEVESGSSMMIDESGVPSAMRGLRAEEVILSNDHFFTRSLEFPEQFPLEGTVTRTFEARSGHFGIDIAADENTVIPAFAEGVVIFSGFTINYGNVVVLQHPGGYLSIYKHSRNLAKQKGDIVRRGDVIGFVGSDGLVSTGPHLHFELWRFGVPVDPAQYFMNLN
ncbi:MAG: M23 family metallopeptidase [Balneolia bacterium]|nr:M23 family metallopeptidase [Balneolia bacterium]